MRNAANPSDRWSHASCSVCCMQDLDGDGFISEEDLMRGYDIFCGDNVEGRYI